MISSLMPRPFPGVKVREEKRKSYQSTCLKIGIPTFELHLTYTSPHETGFTFMVKISFHSRTSPNEPTDIRRERLINKRSGGDL